MSEPNPELLVLVIALICIALAPLCSRLVKDIGTQISSEMDGGRSGEALNKHLDETYEGTAQADEIAQMLEAKAFLRGEAAPTAPAPLSEDDELRDEIRQVVVASNERRARNGEPLRDVESEVARRMADL